MTAVTKNAMSPSSAKKKARVPPRPPEPDEPRADADRKADDDGDDDATKGEWLFKQDDLVLGPVTSIVLVDKIKKGELGGDTPIARDGAAFRPMKLVRLFREAWQAAEEEKRFAAEERAHQAAISRTRFLRVVVVVLLMVVPAAAAAFGARQVMIARPWDDSAAWMARVPPMVDLPQKPPEVKTTPTTPTPTGPVVAANDPAVEEDDDKPGVPRDPNRPKKTKTAGTATATTTNGGGSSSTTPTPAEPEAPKNTAGLPGELTNAQAVAPLKEIQSDLKGCFKAEMDSNADMPGSVVLSYTITEDGKAINVDLDARELRGRPVVGCVQKAMASVRWPKFNGERKNVSVPFKLGKPKPTAPKP